MIGNRWQRRVTSALKAKEKWATKFRCKLLNDYYEGFHWKQKFGRQLANYNPYTINLFYSTIKIKLASYLFQNPKFTLSPRPGNSEWDMDFAMQSAELKQDVLNTIVSNPNTYFADNVKLAALDSFFYFGIIEYGYAADFRNPQKVDQELKSWENSDVLDTKADKVISTNDLPVNERFYVKRINPERFVVGISDATELRDHEWCGYYDYVYTEQLKKTKGIKWPAEADSSFITGDGSDHLTSITDEELKLLVTEGSVSKIWHIFDSVAKERKLFLDGYFDAPLWKIEMQHLPLEELRWDFRTKGFYPIPPTFQWVSAQDEINEAREQTRSYRRRLTRKFQSKRDSVDVEEMEKFTSGPDGEVIITNQDNAIMPILNPDMGALERDALIVAKDDFNIISGTSAEARGQSDRETATQAKLVDMRSRIRESADQMDFTNFLVRIGRGVLVTAQTDLVVGLWMKMESNPNEQMLTDMQVRQPVFRYVTSQHLDDGFDFDVDFAVENSTPASMQEDLQSFQNFVGMIQNFPMLSMSPVLIRETAARCGYRNEKVIQQMQQASVAQMAMKQAAAEQQNKLNGISGGANSNNAGVTLQKQQQIPSADQTGQQIQQQLGVQ